MSLDIALTVAVGLFALVTVSLFGFAAVLFIATVKDWLSR